MCPASQQDFLCAQIEIRSYSQRWLVRKGTAYVYIAMAIDRYVIEHQTAYLAASLWRRFWRGGYFLTNEIVREAPGMERGIGRSIGMTHAGNDFVVNAKSGGM